MFRGAMIFIQIGLLVMAASGTTGYGWILNNTQKLFVEEAKEVTGTVVKLEKDDDKSRPVVNYRAGNETHQITGNARQNGTYARADRVVVLHPPDHPENGELEADLKGEPGTTFIWIGIGLFGITILRTLLWLRRMRRNLDTGAGEITSALERKRQRDQDPSEAPDELPDTDADETPFHQA